MNCPVCTDTQLKMAERQGVEIDFCPKCRGVWLDRGELDKIIARSVTEVPAHAGGGGYDDDDDDRHDYRKEYKRNRKRSFLGDLFDFD